MLSLQKLKENKIKGFSDFVHRPDSKELEDKRTWRLGNWICFQNAMFFIF
jgi:hypothetical protein